MIWLHEENDLDPLYTKDDIEYLKTLPHVYVHQRSGVSILFSHYAYPNLHGLKKEFYTYHDEFRHHFAYMNDINCQISFTGHAHFKGLSVISPKTIKEYRYNKSFVINELPVCISIPSIVANNKKSGFCVFDTSERRVQVISL